MRTDNNREFYFSRGLLVAVISIFLYLIIMACKLLTQTNTIIYSLRSHMIGVG